MAFTQGFPGAGVGERAAQAWRLPMGAVSPLWLVFGAAAGAGVAFWWMSRWTRAINIEALAGAPAPAPIEIVAEPAPTLAVPVLEEVVAEAPILEPVIEPEPEIVAVIEEVAAPDDLTRMVGIGPKLAAALAERGVTRFADIAAWTAKELADFDAALSLKGRAVREAWVAQAKRLAADA